MQPHASQQVIIERAVAKITRPGLPIFANQEIGADQAHYFRWYRRGRPDPESRELGCLCLALPKIRVTVADASSTDH